MVSLLYGVLHLKCLPIVTENEVTIYKPSGKDELMEISDAINEQMRKLHEELKEDNNLIEESLKVFQIVYKDLYL